MRNRRRRHRQAFTLIEVLLVLAILVILGSLAVGMFTNTQKKANVRAAKSQIGLFDTPIQEYHLDLNQFPPSLEALLTAPGELANSSKWGGPYLKEKSVPLDPWGNPYQYTAPGVNNPASYDIWSMGPDGASGTDDDVTNWTP